MKWQPIETFDAKKDFAAIVYSNDTVGEAWFDSVDGEWWWANTDDEYSLPLANVTHWMPLPEPPQEGE